MAKVLSVTDIQIALTRDRPPRVVLHASGTVTTSGWAAARLEPYVYVTPPQDGLLDLDLLAQEPSGPVLMVICPIAASTSFVAPAWCRGVRVHASTGSMEARLGEPVDVPQAQALTGGNGWVSSGKAADPGDTFPWLVAPPRS